MVEMRQGQIEKREAKMHLKSMQKKHKWHKIRDKTKELTEAQGGEQS